MPTALATFAQAQRDGQSVERRPDCVRKLRRIERIPLQSFFEGAREGRHTFELYNPNITDSAASQVSDRLPVGLQPCPPEERTYTRGFWDGDDFEGTVHSLTLPSTGFSIARSRPPPAENEKRVADWIERLPAMTATRVLHICDPGTLGWSYNQVTGENTRGKLSDLCWQRSPLSNTPEVEDTLRRLVVEIKAPCKLCHQSFSTLGANLSQRGSGYRGFQQLCEYQEGSRARFGLSNELT